MSIYNETNEVNLAKYMRKNGERRELSPAELEAFGRMKLMIDDGYRLSRTIGCYIAICMDLQDIPYQVTANLMRVKSSVGKQSAKAYSVKEQFGKVTPEKKEARAINYFFTQYERRKKYVRETVLPAIMELTPIPEYKALFGADVFEEQLRDVTRRRDNEARKGFAEEIISATKENGLGERYKARVEDYMRRDAEIKAIAKRAAAEEKQKKIESLHSDSEELLYDCTRKLEGAYATGKDVPELGWKTKSLNRLQGKAEAPAYIIMIGYIRSGQFKFKYLQGMNGLNDSVGSATVYTGEEQAEQIMRHYLSVRPERAGITMRIL